MGIKFNFCRACCLLLHACQLLKDMYAALGVHEGVNFAGSADKNSAAVVGSKSLREAYSDDAQQATSAVEPSSNGHLVGMVMLPAIRA